MKRQLTLAALFLCSLLTFAQFSGSGSGTESDPYLILNPIQLNQMRNFLNKEKVYFKMMADVDLTEFIEDENPDQGWQPVGSSSSAAFKGFLDGNGKTIKGLWIKRTATDNVGLFGYTAGATIKNVMIEASTIEGKECVGGVSGYSAGTTISGCFLRGTIKGTSKVGGYVGNSGNNMILSDDLAKVTVTGTGDYVGGFIGSNDANFNVSGCTINDGIISGANYVGGLCGSIVVVHRNSNSISNTYIYANISGGDYVGGLCGYSECGNFSVNLTHCGYCGDLAASSKVGGLVGGIRYSSVNIQNSFAIGNISATSNYAGGLIGHIIGGYGNLGITNNYHSGAITGANYVGGLIGYNSGAIISNCYAIGSVAGEQYVGGVVGYQEYYSMLKSSVAVNTRVTATLGNVNRVIGCNDAGRIGAMNSTDENKSYNRTIIISQGVAQDITDNEMNGTSVSATTLKLKATYVAMGWDFNDTWEIQETECYPYFKTQTAPPVITSQVVSGATTVSGKCVDGGTITLDIDGITQQVVSTGNEFSFIVSPLQAGQEVRVSAKAEGKEQSYFTTEIVASLGSGKENDPYQVFTASDLTSAYRKGYYKLMNDIDLTDYINANSPSEGWQSIGRDGSETIHFDGDGHKITGLWCNTTRDNTGLFSCFANGSIKNLTVETAKGKQVKSGANTAILIGKMINGTIENCRVSGTVADGTPVGGLVGLFDGGKISLSQANVTISTTNGTSYVGGLAGEVTGGEIDQCVTLGTITATGKESYVGGLVGKNSATVTNCYSNATVTSSYNAAGLIAYNYGVVDKCYATGNLFSSNYGAGVIGYNDGANAVVKNCVAMNNKIDVTYESQSAQSGGYGQRIIGGIKNGAPAPELNNYALKSMQVSVNDVAQKVYDDIMNGVAKAGADMVKKATYQELGWNFTDIWSITEGDSYPSLKNNAATVLKPGEEPEPEPEPEPVLSTDDVMTVGKVETSSGKTVSIGINLNNKTADLTAYQFDLALPAGIELAQNDKGKYQVTKTNRYDDDSQSLTISLVEGNIYRFVCFSLTNDKINGTEGAILNAILSVGESVKEDTYKAKITNIVFTKADGTQLKLSDASFDIVVSNVKMGDANGDGEVNVSDIVEIVNDILGKPSAKFVKSAADLNSDGEVNVTDIVKLVSIILSDGKARMKAPVLEETDNDEVTLSSNSDQTLSLNLTNRGGYVASQFDLRIDKGMTLESIMLNKGRMDGHLLTYAKTEDNIYRVVVYSVENRPYAGHNGGLLTIKTSGSGNVTIDNILFVTEHQSERRFLPLNMGTTGIQAVENHKAMDVFSLDGRLIRKQTNTTDGLKTGMYIINGKKHIVK